MAPLAKDEGSVMKNTMEESIVSKSLVFLGTRSKDEGAGIFSCFFDPKSGACTQPSLATKMTLPTAFALGREGTYLYSTSETGNDGTCDANLFAYRIDKQTGRLELLNHISSNGGGATHLALDATGNTLVVATFGAGRTNAFRILSDGRLGELTACMQHEGTGPHRRQKSPHAHGVAFSPDNRFVLSADMGADRVFIFRFDECSGVLKPNSPPFFDVPAGWGPRQLVFHPSGKYVYLMNELSAMITVLAWSMKEGVLTQIQTVAAMSPDAEGEPSGGAIAMDPQGRYFYTSTRNDNCIEMFAINPQDGTLSLAQRTKSTGILPWGCALDSTGEYLFISNKDSNSTAIYRVDAAKGCLFLINPGIVSPQPVTGIVLRRELVQRRVAVVGGQRVC